MSDYIRCSTPLCGRRAVAYARGGALRKCDICMERGMHTALTPNAVELMGLPSLNAKPLHPYISDESM